MAYGISPGVTGVYQDLGVQAKNGDTLPGLYSQHTTHWNAILIQSLQERLQQWGGRTRPVDGGQVGPPPALCHARLYKHVAANNRECQLPQKPYELRIIQFR